MAAPTTKDFGLMAGSSWVLLGLKGFNLTEVAMELGDLDPQAAGLFEAPCQGLSELCISDAFFVSETLSGPLDTCEV